MKKALPLVTIVLGTRPEAIKLAPLVHAFLSSSLVKTRVVLTGQHKEMVYPVLKIFQINPDLNLQLMKQGQTLEQITTTVIKGISSDLEKNAPDLLILQGDTNTAFAAGLAAFYNKIPVAHVEAGLRTNDLYDPFPEEVNRRLISQISSLHFAPTKKAYENLYNSSVLGEIHITGNTVIDALQFTASKNTSLDISGINMENKKSILMTVHRRENWGENLNNIIKGVKKTLDEFKDLYILIPMHRNEIVRNPLKDQLNHHKRVILTEPLDYQNLVAAIKNCTLLLTDSGGLQEEAPSLGKPVLIMRKTTERPEAIDAGTAKLVGTNPIEIFENIRLLLENKNEYEKMSKAINPFGDGKASERILDICLKFLYNK